MQLIKRKAICALLLIYMFSLYQPAYAKKIEEPETASLYTELSAQILESIDAFDKLSEKKGAPTRADFLYTLMKAAYPNVEMDIPEGCFKDVEADSFASKSIGAAYSMGYISKADMFLPDDEISKAEAVKLCVCAAGYMVRAEAFGGFPQGYIRVANDIELLDNISFDPMESLTYEESLLLLYNTLTADCMQITGIDKGNNSYTVNKGETILSTVHGIYRTEGIVTADRYGALLHEEKKIQKSDFIEIDGIEYSSKYTFEEMLGRNVTVFYQSRGTDTLSICAAVKYRNNETEIMSGDIQSFGDGVVTYKENDKIKKISVNSAYALLYNGRYRRDRNNEFLNNDYSKIIFVDNDRDNICDVLSVTERQYMSVSGVNSMNNEIYDANNMAYSLKIDDDGVCTVINGENESVPWQLLQEENVYAVQKSVDGQLIKMYELVDSVYGTVTKIERDEKTVIYVDNVAYFVSDYCIRNFPDILSGVKYRFILDGDIIAFPQDKKEPMKYGYIVKSHTDHGIKTKLSVKLLTVSGSMLVTNLDDTVVLDGKKKDLRADLSAIEAAIENPQLIRYQLNEDGAVRKIDTAQTADIYLPDNESVGDNSLLYYPYTQTPRYKSYSFMLAPYACIRGSMIFVVPENPEYSDDDDRYGVVGYNALNLRVNVQYPMQIYDLNKYGDAAVLVYKSDTAFDSSMEKQNAALVEKVARVPDGGYKLYLIEGLSSKTCIAEEDVDGISNVRPGDIIRYSNFSNGDIRNIAIDYSAKSETFAPSVVVNDKFTTNELNYHCGRVYSMANNFMYISPAASRAEECNYYWQDLCLLRIPAAVVLYDTQTNTGRPAEMSEIVQYVSSGLEPSYVVMQADQYFYGKMLVIYK